MSYNSRCLSLHFGFPRWPGLPSARAQDHELADFAELLCLKQGVVSTTALSSALGRLDENDYTNGVPEEEEHGVARVVEAAFTEIDRRREACGEGYPFETGEQGYTLRLPNENSNTERTLLYHYLLLSTRLNMKDNRVHDEIDGTLLFENVSAEIVKNFFGHRANSYVFGTAGGSADFQGRVDDLCNRIGEGSGFRNRDDAEPTEKDGKLDVITWKPFADGREGKLIAFGQCKTGTEWKSSLNQLHPDSFCSKWMKDQPTQVPIRIFFVTEALPRSRWRSMSCDAGILLDRCRIIDYATGLSESTSTKMRRWVMAAAKATELPVENLPQPEL